MTSLELGLAMHWPLRDAAMGELMSYGAERWLETKDGKWERPMVCVTIRPGITVKIYSIY